MRKTAINTVGDVPWGTHFCLFYKTKKDLTDMLVPFFKAGLENNEFCMWITSEPLKAEEATKALKKKLKNLDDYIENGQIEILDHSQWYTKPGYFDSDRVLNGWIEKEKQALNKGFDGLRLSGNTFWLEKRDWQDFTDYEAVINNIIGKYRMLAVCTYSLAKCTATEITDVVSNHQFALIKQEGKWKLIESSEQKKAREALRESEERYHTLFENAHIPIWEEDFSEVKSHFDRLRASGVQDFRSYFKNHPEEIKDVARRVKILDVSQESLELFTVGSKEEILAHMPYFLIEESWPVFSDALIALVNGESKFESEISIRMISGEFKVLAFRLSVPPNYRVTLSKVLVSFIDITKRRRAEEIIHISQRYLKLINKHSEMLPLLQEFVAETKNYTKADAVGIRILDNEGNISYQAYEGFSDEFYDSESFLSIKSDQCMCINVIKGQTDPNLHYYTDGGSFIMNNSTRFLANVSEEEKGETRNVCNQFGYESIALVPIIHGKHILGLIHIADTRENMVPHDLIAVLEGAAIQLGTAIKRVETREELKKSERELSLRNKIANIFLTVSDEAIYNEVLQAILKEMKSDYGLFGYIDEGGSLVLASLTKEIWDECKIPDKTIVFPREKWRGIWGQSLIEKKSLYSNKPMDVPKGHIPINKVLVVPITFKKEAIGIFTVANKIKDYDKNDRKILEVIAEKISPVLHARLQRDKQLRRRLHAEKALRNLRRQLKTEIGFAGIIGSDPKMLEIFDTIKELAEVDVPVLIQGESGTGKELVAMAIHNEGHRAHQPFIPVNCGALPEGLLESELFGHVRGAFTGAIRDKKGRFELANHGTIFLDEIGDLSPSLQVKLLRVLQEGRFERVGGEKTIKVNVRVISATNKDLETEINEGRFRSDLFYRMCVVPITIPPLRGRRGDIPHLIEYILKQAMKEQDRKDVELSPEVLAAMIGYNWPGNVRELQNSIQYALLKCRGNRILIDHLPSTIYSITSFAKRIEERPRKRKLNAEAVERALSETKGNKVKAARSLGVSRATLYRFLNLMNNLENSKNS
ncbi:MAG: sigma 54-interacting transcriptional regulator [Candidatus Aminicenantes bacterium]|nr:MAG: sigma 54-interacting transcriptional regulator [Candidatus Aminicenantes bacterium]